MNWVVALGAMLFAAFALTLIAPIVLHDPFVGMPFENARSDRC